jgi:hypothetical protein
MSPSVRQEYEFELIRLNHLMEIHNRVQIQVRFLEQHWNELDLERMTKFKRMQTRASLLRVLIYRKEAKIKQLGTFL